MDIIYILIYKNNNFIAKNEYKILNFTKNDTEIVKRIKDYAKRNCREQINTSYITSTLQNFDYGISYFRTEILTKDNSEKNRPKKHQNIFWCFYA